ncbi:MAG: twin-arginine translocation signal domain-containing protein, partial [Acidobacteria bacterium]
MANPHDTRPDDPQRKTANGLTRRDFVKTGAAAGLGAGALLKPGQ